MRKFSTQNRLSPAGPTPWGTHRALGKQGQPTPVLLPGESHGQSGLAGYSPRGCRESDTTERLPLSLFTLGKQTREVCWAVAWGRWEEGPREEPGAA